MSTLSGLLLILLLTVLPSLTVADEPAAVSDCPKDLVTTSEYARLIRAQRDQYEIEIARLRAHVTILESEVVRLRASPPPPPMRTLP